MKSSSARPLRNWDVCLGVSGMHAATSGHNWTSRKSATLIFRWEPLQQLLEGSVYKWPIERQRFGPFSNILSCSVAVLIATFIQNIFCYRNILFSLCSCTTHFAFDLKQPKMIHSKLSVYNLKIYEKKGFNKNDLNWIWLFDIPFNIIID